MSKFMTFKCNNVLSFSTNKLLKMIAKTYIFLFFSLLFGFSPNNVLSQSIKLKIDSDKTLTVDEIFDLIMDQTNYMFIYPDGAFNNYPKVKVKKGTILANKLIESSLETGNFEAIIGVDNTIVIKEKLIDNSQIALPFLVSGTVINENREPLPGATVIEKGTSNGAQTDFDGNFSIEVTNEKAILVISYVGYGTREISINSQNKITIQLSSEASQLNEIVLTGYGKQIRKTLSSSISKVSGDVIEGFPVPSFEAALQGRAAGVQVTTNGAMSGAPVKIRIRGSNSALASSDPLYVIDGVVIESGTQVNDNPVGGFYLDVGTNVLASINPNDIESMEILKDAAATSIYGARGSNGVILITTKKGKIGKTKLNMAVSSGVSDATKRIEYANAQEYLFLAQEAWYNSGNDPLKFWSNSGVLIDGLTREQALNTDTDWQDEALKIGFSTNLNVSASGGDEKTSFYVSGNLLDEKSIFVGNEYFRLSARTNIDHKISDKFKIGSTTTYSAVDNNPVPIQEALGKSTNSLPIWPVRKSDGSYFNPINNVRASIDLWDINVKSKQFLSSWYLNYEVADGLVFRSEYGLNSISTFQQQYRDASINFNGLATAFNSQGDRHSWNFKNLLNYTKKIEGHNFDLLVGIESQKTTEKSSVIRGQGFANSTLRTPQDGAESSSIYNESAYTFASFFSRVEYNYEGKYLLSLTVRRDGSSRFGVNNKWGVFPAASIGYNISEESYFEPLKNVINYLKVRSSYGLVGNAEIGNYAFASTYSRFNYDNNNGITLSNIADDELGWETTKQLDLGVSFELFDGKIRGDIDYYDKLTSDLLLPFPVSVISGQTQVTTNLGEISNKGFEIMLGGDVIDNGAFTWNTELTLARNKNEVVDLGNNTDGLIIPGLFGNTAIYKGKQIGTEAVVIWLGIDPATGLDIYQDKFGNALRMDQAIAEYGSINNFLGNNLVPFGNPFPDITGGINNSFKWNNWYASALLTFEYGANYIANGEAINSKYAFSSFNASPLRYQLNRWRNPGDITDVARLNTDPTIYTGTSQYVSDVDYLRLRDLTVGYIINPKNKSAFENVNIYLKLTNYLTFTNAKPWVYDPENYRRDGNINQLGIWKSSPQAKTMSLGLNINF